MNTLINAEQVGALAFGCGEMVHQEIISECDIVEAEERYIRPILGDKLLTALCEGRYPELMSDYVAPALAAWCRYVVEPHVVSRCSLCDNVTSADNERLDIVMSHLRRQASTLTQRLSRHLNSHIADYEDYNPKSNPLNRCSIYGSIVQVY